MTREAFVVDDVFGAGGRLGDTVVIEDGQIAFIGTEADLDLSESPHRHPGHQIVPPLIDCHLHPLGYATLITGISLMGARSMDELTEIIRTAPGSGPVVAQRLDDTALGAMPTRHDLDVARPDVPVIAYRYCGHVAVVNTAALELAGIRKDTADPKGGRIDRDQMGYPTGVLRETAIEIVGAALGPHVPPPERATTLAALDGLAAVGLQRIVGIVAAGEPLWCGVGVELDTLCDLAPDLPIDIEVIVIAADPDELRRSAADIDRAGGRLRFRGWKAFADGSLGGHTAAMWKPFVDQPTNRGTLRLEPEWAARMVGAALELGGMAAIHAIGDRAIDATLDVYETILEEGADPNSLRIEHVSVPTDGAIERMATSGVVASIQPSFLNSEGGWVPERLGPQRPAYRFASMAAAGVRMVGGSDCPVERPDPLAGIAAAIARPGWADREHLDPGAAVQLFSTDAASHLGVEPGLAPGGPADLTLVRGSVEASPTVAGVMHSGRWIDLRPAVWPG